MILNFFFNASLEATGGNAKLKTHAFGKLLELKDKFDFCDIGEQNILKLKPLVSKTFFWFYPLQIGLHWITSL